jgi:hypothetical protein
MRVNHGGRYVFVSEEFLHGPYVGAGFEEMSGEAMSKGMRRSRFCYLSSLGGRFDGTLQQALVHMMAADDARAWISRNISRREDVLPAPFTSGIGILAFERMREPDAAQSIDGI